MLPDRVSNPGHLTYESDALPIALRGPANTVANSIMCLSIGTSEKKIYFICPKWKISYFWTSQNLDIIVLWSGLKCHHTNS